MKRFEFITLFAFCVAAHFSFLNIMNAEESGNGTLPPSLISKMPAADRWTEITDIGEKADIFSLIYNSAQANYEKIKTWEAEYKFHLWSDYTGYMRTITFLSEEEKLKQAVTKSENTLVFFLDIPKEMLNWKFVADKYFRYDESRSTWIEEDPKFSINFQNIYHKNRTIELELKIARGMTDKIKDYTLNSRVAYDRAGIYKTRSPMSQRSDPRFFYCPMIVSLDSTFWQGYDQCSEMLRGNNDEKKKVVDERYVILKCTVNDSVLYKVERWFPGRKCKTLEIYYDSKVGFNPVECDARFCNGYTITQKRWEWQEQDGIFIPKRYDWNCADRTQLITYELVESKLNQTIPDEKFTYKGLDVSEGDLIFDEQEKMVYTITKRGNKRAFCPYGGEVIKTGKFHYPSMARLFFIVLGFVLIVGGLLGKILVFHRRKKSIP
jgi:hypothetical protein